MTPKITPQILAQDQPSGRPEALVDIELRQRLDEQVPLELPFRDEAGREVNLGEYFGAKPVILALVYYDCPMLCTLVLNGLLTCLDVVSFAAGAEYEVVVVSIDPEETPELAAQKKAAYLERSKRPGDAAGWHFLTGEAPAIEALAAAVGFKYVYDPDSDQFAHASGIMVLTPGGKLARYFYGVEYSARDVQFALMEASEDRIGSLTDQLLLFCYQYDPETGTYGAAIFFIMRVAALLTLALLAGGIFLMRWRERRLAHAGGGGAQP
jgi:protein SCO1/2